MRNKYKYLFVLALIVISSMVLFGCQGQKIGVEISESADNSENTSSTDDNSSKNDNDGVNDEAIGALIKDEKIPSYQFQFLDGSSANIDDYEGNVVILTFFTTWCSYCQKEIPSLEKLANEIEDLTIIGIDVQENPEDVAKFVEDMGITFPIYCDKDGKLKEKFFINGFPSSAFISSDGLYMGLIPGYVQEENLLKAINFARDYKPESKTE